MEPDFTPGMHWMLVAEWVILMKMIYDKSKQGNVRCGWQEMLNIEVDILLWKSCETQCYTMGEDRKEDYARKIRWGYIQLLGR